MVLDFYHMIVDFLTENVELVALCLALVQLIKLAIEKQAWYSKWMGVVIAGIVSFALALPATFEAFEVVPFLAGGLGLFGMATGVYKLLKDLMSSISQ